MDANTYNFVSLVTSGFCIVAMLLISIRQMAEVRRPRNGFTMLRWYLLILPLIVTVGVSLRLERLVEIIHQSPVNSAAARASVGVNIVIAALTLLLILIYTYKEKR